MKPVYVQNDFQKHIKEMAARRGITMTEMVTLAIRAWLKQNGDGNVAPKPSNPVKPR